MQRLIRSIYYVVFVYLGALFSIVLIYIDGMHRSNGDYTFVRGHLFFGVLVAFYITKTDKDYLIKAIPLRILIGVVMSLGLIAFAIDMYNKYSV